MQRSERYAPFLYLIHKAGRATRTNQDLKISLIEAFQYSGSYLLETNTIIIMIEIVLRLFRYRLGEGNSVTHIMSLINIDARLFIYRGEIRVIIVSS